MVLTSNATRELSEALKRRCLFLHIDFPSPDLERRILLSRVPELPAHLAEELVRIIGVLRGMQLKKVPSIAETIDWGRTLLALGLDTIDDAVVAADAGRGPQASIRSAACGRRRQLRLRFFRSTLLIGLILEDHAKRLGDLHHRRRWCPGPARAGCGRRSSRPWTAPS